MLRNTRSIWHQREFFYNNEKLDLPTSMGKIVVTKIGTYTIVNGIEGTYLLTKK